MRISRTSWIYIALMVMELVAFCFGDHDPDLLVMVVLLGVIVSYEQENDKLKERRENE